MNVDKFKKQLDILRGCLEPKSRFKVGDVVIPQGHTLLRSGCSAYDHAIVVHTDPLTLVSEEGDMLWQSTTATMDLKIIGKAKKKAFETAMERFKRG